MRRRIMWAGGILLALAAAFTILLFTAPEAPPFPFLRGHAPLEIEYSPAELAQLQMGRRWQRVYTFRADFDKLIHVMDRQLAAKDLLPFPGAHWPGPDMRIYMRASFVKSRPGDYLPSESNHQVHVQKDTRALGRSHNTAKEKGWVTVIVDFPERPSILDNFRAWLGL